MQYKWQTDVALEGDFAVAYGRKWHFDDKAVSRIVLKDGEIPFASARSVVRSELKTGLGNGVSVVYSDFENYPELSFETRVQVNGTTGMIDFTFVPLKTDSLNITEVRWPAPVCADEHGSYAVLNTMQGQILPTDWPVEIGKALPFNGQMCSESAYMPWWGEVAPDGAYMAVVRAPWDSAYDISHPAGGPTRVSLRHLPSMGKMAYPRTVSYMFFPAGSDYNDLCKAYRKIAEEEGRVRTLKEKAAANPTLANLIGACVFHVPGKEHISPDSRYYDKEHPEKNDSLHPFNSWNDTLDKARELGVEKLYLHLDGWGEHGYDNQHPDYLPACAEAGGWEGMKALQDKLHSLGYLFGLHDQYRDYYLDAESYDPDNAMMMADGTIYSHAIWAGGKQNYLCAELAFDYVQRNFEELYRHGIHPDCTYLDVFTCNEADECVNPHHPMTRKDSLEARARCFRYLTANNILPSSEEVNDWAMQSLYFCHWAPYFGETAIPVPLFNLVYHDCVLIPWKLGGPQWGIPEGTTGFLHALLNGDMGYLEYDLTGDEFKQNAEQVKELRKLTERVAMSQMVKHEFLSDDKKRQRTTFADGTTVTVDFGDNSWNVSEG